ncbi:hypothetical protein [Myroides injenensis]|uniref:hypothetical protein n=1 Tax=Myroides injenensis TaxID=1183151 RepID=UPI000288787C|nr:hypothetical protein [Myroides injenensis]
MVTHSPFILSDIPSQNILRLKECKPDSIESKNSFAANIYDLLNDEFFLNDGVIGSYAQEFINKIINDIDVVESDVEKEQISELNNRIDIVGDELIRSSLDNFLFEKVADSQFEIDILKKRIKELESKAKKNEKDKDR